MSWKHFRSPNWSARKKQNKKRKPPQARLEVEQLESRWLPSAVRLTTPTWLVREDFGALAMGVVLDAPATQIITVNYATVSGTASPGSDYTAASGTLTFNPGETSKTFTVSILTDAINEGDESFSVNLSGPTNATLGSPASATITIQDLNPAPWTATGVHRTTDPGQGLFLPFGSDFVSPQTGSVRVVHELTYRPEFNQVIADHRSDADHRPPRSGTNPDRGNTHLGRNPAESGGIHNDGQCGHHLPAAGSSQYAGHSDWPLRLVADAHGDFLQRRSHNPSCLRSSGGGRSRPGQQSVRSRLECGRVGSTGSRRRRCLVRLR